MAAFSLAQYESTVDDLSSGLDKLSSKLDEVWPTVQHAVDHWYIPGVVADGVEWVGRKLLELGNWILEKIIELLKGAVAPVYMYLNSQDLEGIRDLASGVAGDLNPATLQVGRVWHGGAVQAYSAQIPPQVNAAARIATAADKTATSLEICAAGGLVFYLALGVIVVKFIIATIAAIAALGSVVFSWAGAALIVEEAGVNTGLILAALGALTALLGAQATQMISIGGEAGDAANFPDGHWPNATPGQFSDATVKDGDADWSLKS
jgi:uncharacterized protein YukE